MNFTQQNSVSVS